MCRLMALLAVVAACAASGGPITELKPLYPRTEIIVGGQAKAAIVVPDAPALKQMAEELAAQLEKRGGARLEVLSADSVVSEDWQISFGRVAGRNLIALGNINDNRLLAVLWGERYVVADSIFPGEGGYVVRTVHDPFARGVNVVVLAGSEADGVQRAVDVFCETYLPKAGGDIVLPQPITDTEFARTEKRFFPPPTHYLSSKRQPQYSTIEYFQKLFKDSGLMDDEGNVLSKKGGTLASVTGPIARLAQTHFRTGDPQLPPLMKQILDRNRHLLKIVPRRVEMEASSAAHLVWWDIVEELSIWTDQDRLDIANAILSDSLQGHERRAAHKMAEEGFVQVVDENHGTNSALNSFWAWRYFDKYYDLPETDYWMSVARATFAGQCASHQILEDAAGYLCYCPIHAMKYAVASRDMRYFELEIARTYAEFIAQCAVNNLGLSTGFGDSSSLVAPAVFEDLAPASWYYRDPRLAWVARNVLPQACGLRIFQSAIPVDLSVEPKEPVEWTGMSVFPIFKQPLRKGEGAKEFTTAPKESAGPEWFNKIVFRESWDPEAQYLLLDGAGKFGTREGYPNGPAGHRHDDVNTIINFTDEGRMWLVDHTYGTRNIKDHSGLYITRNGHISYKVHEAKLRDFARGEHLALCRSVFEGFSGADWERTIFWDRGRHFVVMDRVIAREPGDYVVRCSFRGLGEQELRGNRMRLTQDGKLCDIVSNGGASLDVVEFAFPAQREWTTWYKHARPVAKVFQQDKSGHLEPGEAVCFANLIRAAGSEEDLDAVKLIPVSDTAVIVESKEGQALYGLGSPPGGVVEARAYAVSSQEALFAGLTRLGGAKEPLLTASNPVDIALSAGGEAWIESDGPVSIKLAGRGEAIELRAGWHKVPLDGLAAGVKTVLALALSSAHEQAGGYQAPDGGREDKAFGLTMQRVELGTRIARMQVADLHGDGKAEWIVVGSEGAAAFKPDGARLWQFDTEQPCRALDVGDVDGDGKMEVAVGCDDAKVYLLGPEGSQRWSFECKPSGLHTLPPAVDLVAIADLDADGTPEIVVGANWVHCLAADGQVKWEKYLRFARGRICGDFKTGAVADLDADGRLEVLALFLYSYHQALAFDAEGNIILPRDYDNDRRFGVNIGRPHCVLLADLLAKQEGLQFVVGGDKYLYTYWGAGKLAGQSGGRKSGCYIALASHQPPGEHPFIYAATDMGAVIAYRAGAPRNDHWIMLETPWTRVIGERIRVLWAGDANGDGTVEVLVGAKSGVVHALDALSGELVARSRATGSPVVDFARSATGVLGVHGDGVVEALAFD